MGNRSLFAWNEWFLILMNINAFKIIFPLIIYLWEYEG